MTEIEDRFWMKVEKQPSSCWIWTGGKQSAGFGIFNYHGTPKIAQTVSWKFFTGEFPDSYLRNSCKNKLCVNPEHLSSTDSLENNLNRFWKYVDKSGECWIWTGNDSDKTYGSFFITINGVTIHQGAHRAAYRMLVGEPPEGYEIDHLCEVTLCVRPEHLEAVTKEENFRRSNNNSKKTHCPQGHEYNASNTTVSNNRRHCRTCAREKAALRRQAKRERDY